MLKRLIQCATLLGLGASVSAAGADGRASLLQGVAELRAQQYPQAEAVFEAVVEAYPGSLEAGYYLGQALYYQGRLAEAQARFLRVAASDPGIPVAYYYLGRIAFDRNRMPEAEAYLKRADRIDSDVSMVHYYLGLVYDREQRSGEALGQFRSALLLEPSLTRASYAQAYILFHAFRKSPEALAVLRSAAKTKDRDLRRKLSALRRQIESGS